MNQTITVHYEEKPAYDILLEPDFHRLAEALGALDMTNRRFMILSDSNVSELYLEDVTEALKPVAGTVRHLVLTAGEASKNLDNVSKCYEKLIEAGFDRKDVLVALGGGVIGDLTGFAAATYLRGIRFIQLPTSLLAMVDSSIGGKTGVDYKAYKNMVGAFHQPKLVYMNLTALQSLPEPEFNSGMGEIIKHGLIKDKAYYQWLRENAKSIQSRSYEALQEMIRRSCLIKKEVVERDPKELGERALLNFGHTIGHSVEKLKEFSLLHGECICVGMAAAAYLSCKRGNITPEEYYGLLDTIRRFKEPVKVDGLSAEEVYEVTRLDKKMDSDKIRFILLRDIGRAEIDPSVTKEEMLEAIRTVLE